MIFSIAFDFAIEIRMNNTPQGDGNSSCDNILFSCSLSYKNE